MTQKSESEAPKKPLSARQQLVATVAGSVASGIVRDPKETDTAATIAEISVDIANEIVKRAEIT